MHNAQHRIRRDCHVDYCDSDFVRDCYLKSKGDLNSLAAEAISQTVDLTKNVMKTY